MRWSQLTNSLLRWTDGIRYQQRLHHGEATHALGTWGEDVAHRYLRGQGMTVVARSFRTRSGSAEVDLIAWDGEALVFVEVKTRQSDEYGAPERAVDREKRRKIIQAAREYMRRADVPWHQARFDVVSVVTGTAASQQPSEGPTAQSRPSPQNRPPAVTHLRDVFQVEVR